MKTATNRRNVLKGLACSLALATAAITSTAFKALEPEYNASDYVDQMLANTDQTLHPAIYIKDGQEVGVRGWLPETTPGSDRTGNHFEAFKAELRKRGLLMIWTRSQIVYEDTSERLTFATYQSQEQRQKTNSPHT